MSKIYYICTREKNKINGHLRGCKSHAVSAIEFVYEL